MDPRPVRVLVVDDSALIRQMLGRLLREQGIDVVGSARDGLDALERVAELSPDVVTMDVEMPRLDGLGALERLLAERPTPVIMCSALTEAGASATVRALELGAVDFVTKPRVGQPFDEVAAELARKIRAVAGARVRPGGAAPAERPRPSASAARASAPTSRTPAVDPGAARAAPRPRTSGGTRLIVVASSTGGPNALVKVLSALPGDLPAALVVVQHMPAGFTRSLADRLDQHSALTVREAETGDEPRPGLALLAPGNRHLDFDALGRIRLDDGPPEHGVRPAADVALRGAARAYAGAVDLVVLTGMGSDGTDGARAVKAVGARVIAEAESTAVVWGMPGSIVNAGLADDVVPLPEIPARIVALAVR